MGGARAQSNTDIYAQRINAGGIVQWTAEGVAICTAINNQIYPSMVSDGNGGAFITWQDCATVVIMISMRNESTPIVQYIGLLTVLLFARNG